MLPAKCVSRVAVVCLGVLVVLLAGCGSPATVQFRPKPGDMRNYRATLNRTAEMNAMGQKTNQSTTTVTGYTQEVSDVAADGTATMKVTFTEMVLGDLGGLSAMTGGLSAGLGDAMNVLGKSFTMKASPTGRISSVEGMEPVVKEMSEKMSALLKEELGKMQLPPEAMGMLGQIDTVMGSVLRRSLGDSAMREAMEDGMTMYSETPQKVGSTWTRGVIRESGMEPMERGESWTLKERKNGVLTLERKSVISPNTQASGITMGPMTMRIDLTGTDSGTFQVDEATGWVISGTLSRQLEGKMDLLGMPMPGGQDMTMKITDTVTLETL